VEDRTCVPSRWHGNSRAATRGIVTNCKSETAREKPFFKNAWLHCRCLIPADGFYEWKQEGTRKQPYRFVLRADEPFWFAGLWKPATKKHDDASSDRHPDAGSQCGRCAAAQPDAFDTSPDELERW